MVYSFIKKNKSILFILLVSIFPLLDLLRDGLPITHDSVLHAARIASFFSSLQDGILIPRWSENLNWGYGHPILMFVYPLPSYFAAMLHFIGFSFVDSVKILYAASFSVSGIFMFFWLRKFLGESASIVGSILYMFAPYRFVDLYVRGALGENIAFIFMPLVLLYILNINNLNKKSKFKNYFYNFLFLTLSFAFLILSHNAISLIFIPFIIFYVSYEFFDKKNKKNLALAIGALIYGLLISFFFWFPALIEGKYTLKDIVTAGGYLNTFVDINKLIYSSWNFGGTGQFSVSIGIIQIIIIIFSVLIFKKNFNKKENLRFLYLGLLFFLLASVFLMLNPSSIIWEKITILQKLQFTWRFLAIITFCSATIGAIFIDKLKIKYKNIFTGVLIIASILITLNYWHAKEYKAFKDSFFQKEFGATTDTGECSPIWSIRSMDKFPKGKIELLEGDATIIEFSRKSTIHEYLIENKSKIRIKENTLYFPGWKIYDNNKQLENIEFQDPKNRGVMTFYLNPGIHNIILKFENTKLRTFSELISFISAIMLFGIPLIFIISSHKLKGQIK